MSEYRKMHPGSVELSWVLKVSQSLWLLRGSWVPSCQWKFRWEVLVPVWVALERLRIGEERWQVLNRSRVTRVPQVALSWCHQLACSKVCLQRGWEERALAVPQRGRGIHSDLEGGRDARPNWRLPEGLKNTWKIPSKAWGIYGRQSHSNHWESLDRKRLKEKRTWGQRREEDFGANKELFAICSVGRKEIWEHLLVVDGKRQWRQQE